jgi:hypothetical protein
MQEYKLATFDEDYPQGFDDAPEDEEYEQWWEDYDEEDVEPFHSDPYESN